MTVWPWGFAAMALLNSEQNWLAAVVESFRMGDWQAHHFKPLGVGVMASGVLRDNYCMSLDSH